ncbi:hypothetical protein HK098_004866 [Nowakowskiella sp. JEL0407]|nr:hypothetical protein HK098_004866 [Nowakowskiella sp. JEL0407]
MRKKDPSLALGHASISSKLRSLNLPHLKIRDISFNVAPISTSPNVNFTSFCSDAEDRILSERADLVCFGGFVWNEAYIQNITRSIKSKYSAQKLLLGGPQVTYAEKGTLERYYPSVDWFVRGYAEQAVADLVKNTMLNKHTQIEGLHRAGNEDLGIQAKIDINELPSPIRGEFSTISLTNQSFLRWETKRGCPFRCSFCQHKDLYQKRSQLPPDRILREIQAIKQSSVNDLAVLDPTFNAGREYLSIMEELSGYIGKVTLQCRFEMVNEEFMEWCVKLIRRGANLVLEFGLQTANPLEAGAIQRPNNLKKVVGVANSLRERGIPFEISLIYGLPLQTVKSFEESIQFCQALKPTNLIAWPLMLLRGTPLYRDRDKYEMSERTFLFDEKHQLYECEGKNERIHSGIPHVVSSSTFSKEDWIQMRQLAREL